MRGKPILIILALLMVAPVLTACDSFDMDKLDIFKLNEKKKLQGERKPLFPEGVPGVVQGIPPDLVQGYQPPAETKVAEPEPVKEKPKPRVVKQAAKPKPTQVTVQPPQQQQQQQPQQQQPPPQQQQQAQQPAWPEPKPQATGTQAPWPATTQQQPSPWPAAPAPNTFQR